MDMKVEHRLPSCGAIKLHYGHAIGLKSAFCRISDLLNGRKERLKNKRISVQ